jgi:hypothetical protein
VETIEYLWVGHACLVVAAFPPQAALASCFLS